MFSFLFIPPPPSTAYHVAYQQLHLTLYRVAPVYDDGAGDDGCNSESGSGGGGGGGGGGEGEGVIYGNVSYYKDDVEVMMCEGGRRRDMNLLVCVLVT